MWSCKRGIAPITIVIADTYPSSRRSLKMMRLRLAAGAYKHRNRFRRSTFKTISSYKDLIRPPLPRLEVPLFSLLFNSSTIHTAAVLLLRVAFHTLESRRILLVRALRRRIRCIRNSNTRPKGHFREHPTPWVYPTPIYQDMHRRQTNTHMPLATDKNHIHPWHDRWESWSAKNLLTGFVVCFRSI